MWFVFTLHVIKQGERIKRQTVMHRYKLGSIVLIMLRTLAGSIYITKNKKVQHHQKIGVSILHKIVESSLILYSTIEESSPTKSRHQPVVG